MAPREPKRARPPAPADDWALFLDVDGCLLDLAPHPDQVSVPARLRTTLDSLARRLDGALALVSGRSLAGLDALFAPLRLPAWRPPAAREASRSGSGPRWTAWRGGWTARWPWSAAVRSRAWTPCSPPCACQPPACTGWNGVRARRHERLRHHHRPWPPSTPKPKRSQRNIRARWSRTRGQRSACTGAPRRPPWRRYAVSPRRRCRACRDSACSTATAWSSCALPAATRAQRSRR